MPLARSASTVARMSLGGERDVLAAGAVVELEVLVDLRLLRRDRRLVERELHPVVAAGDHLAHQRRVVGGDVVADELRHVGEAHHLVVEADPLVHPAELDVADAVVDGLEVALRLPSRTGHRGRRQRRSRAGRGRRSRLRSTRVCRVSPYVAIAAVRTVPCSSDSSCGSTRTVAPCARACAMQRSTSGTSIGRSTTPSPCARWWSSSGLSGRDAAGEARSAPSRSGARSSWSRGGRSPDRGRPRAPCPSRAGSRPRSGSRCRPRSRRRPARSPGTGRRWRRTPPGRRAPAAARG